MGSSNRRQAGRVPCEAPLRIEAGEQRSLYAALVDISRTGLRLRAAGALFGVHRLSSLVQVARRVTTLLGERFFAQIDPEHLGPLIRKELRIVRMAKRDWERADVEIGCVMAEPMTDEEATMLGLSLPPLEGSAADAEEAARPRLRCLQAEDGYQVSLYSPDRPDVQPLTARTESLTRGMVIVCVEDGADHLGELDAAEIVLALDEAYGTEVTLHLTDESEDLWVGPAEIKEVEIAPAPPRELRLGVAFRREMRADELHRLGLPSPA